MPTVVWYPVSFSTYIKSSQMITYKYFFITKIDVSSYFNKCEIDLSEKLLVSIYSNAFRESKIKKLILPLTLTEIYNSAFKDCNSLQTINLNELIHLTKIGDFCFDNCISLRYLNNSDSKINDLSKLTKLTKIGKYCFRKCKKLKNVIYPKNINLKNLY